MTHLMQTATPNDTDLVLTRVFDAPRERVFEACTDPALMMRWFVAPGHALVACEEDQRAGGGYRWVVSTPDGTEATWRGVYHAFEPPVRVAATQLRDGAEPQGDTEAMVTTELTEMAGRTTLTCTVRYPSRAMRDAAVASGLTHEDAAAYDRLAALLDAGAA